MFLIFNGLAKYGVATAVLLFHGPSSFFDVIEHLGLNGRSVGDDGLGVGIHFQYRTAARTGNFEGYWGTPRHNQNDIAKTEFSAVPT